MSGASFQEVFLLIVIGLVVLGPKRLPQVANQLGSWLGQARRMTRMMKRQLEDEINLDLDQVNLNKQMGLDDVLNPTDKPSVEKPGYVQDKKPAPSSETTLADSGPDEAALVEPDDDREELPDDYSPAHAADEAGTGVGDDDEYLQAAESADAVAANEAVAADEAADEDPAAKPKTETA